MNINRFLLQCGLTLGAAIFSLSSIAEAAEQDPAVAAKDQQIKMGIQLYYMKGCVGCHGGQAEGMLPKDAPRLTGLSEAYLTRQIAHFRDGVRGADFKDVYGRQMPMPANSLPDAQIQILSSFLATLQPRGTAEQQSYPSTDLENGKKLFDAKCASCHGANAEGIDALSSPGLAGQQNTYLIRQVKNFQQGIRGAHQADSQGKQMASVAGLLQSEQDIIDVSSYVGSLGTPVHSDFDATDNKQVVLNYYKRLDGGDKQAIFDFLATDVVFHFPGNNAKGAHGYWSFVSQIGAYVPDYKHVLEDVSISEEDASLVKVGSISVVGNTAAGEHKVFPGSAEYRVVDGKITEAWVNPPAQP